MSSFNNFVYDSSSANFDVSDEEATPQGFAFKPDGTKMYVCGEDQVVYQYTLSTSWIVKSASYDSVSFDVSDEMAGQAGTEPTGISFKPDGTKMYILNGDTGLDLDAVYEYDLSTPWVVSTASYDSVNFSTASQTSSDSGGLFFKPDGTKMYVAATSSVFQYSLSSAWDLSSASYDSKAVNTSSEQTNLTGVALSPDGTNIYVTGTNIDQSVQYTLSTPWDISTASYEDVILSNTSSSDLAFNHSYTRLYILGGTIGQYSIPSGMIGMF